MVTDPNSAAVDAVVARHREVRVTETAVDLARQRLDIFSPCALGNALDDQIVAALSAQIICGGANNQLAHEGTANR